VRCANVCWLPVLAEGRDCAVGRAVGAVSASPRTVGVPVCHPRPVRGAADAVDGAARIRCVADRGVTAFGRRAASYESGVVGQLHRRISAWVAEIALAAVAEPGRVLDVGCGTGALLRLLATRLPDAELLAGIGPDSGMVETAYSVGPRTGPADPGGQRRRRGAGLPHRHVRPARDRHLVRPPGRSTTRSHRVLPGAAPRRPLLLCDLFSLVLLPTRWLGRRSKARARPSATGMLTAAGFRSLAWRPSVLMKTVVAT
jgi:hypothetical protein